MSGRRGRRTAAYTKLPYGASVMCRCGHTFALHGSTPPFGCALHTRIMGYRCTCESFSPTNVHVLLKR